MTEPDNLITWTQPEPSVWIPTLNRLYKVSTAAEIVGCTVGTLARYEKAGELVMVDTVLGKRIRHSDLVKFINVKHGSK